MIIMQYGFTLPADYDMSVIERRIQDNGHKLDGFPGLLLKAFLFSRRDDAALSAEENRYAPLYVWKNAEAMTRFLQSAGFIGLTQDFGWPQINTWLTLRIPVVEEIRNHPFLSISKQPIPDHSHLAALNLEGQLCGWDVSQWQLLDVTFLNSPLQGNDNYRIGYLAAEENSLRQGNKT